MKAPRRRYYVLTWDTEIQEWSPQFGVRVGPYSLFGLRKAIRQLREVGYAADRGDSSVMVECCTRYEFNVKDIRKRVAKQRALVAQHPMRPF